MIRKRKTVSDKETKTQVVPKCKEKTKKTKSVKAIAPPPTMTHELRQIAKHKVHVVYGIDEAGRGPLLGPVVAAALAFAPGVTIPASIKDSKKFLSNKRAMRDVYDELMVMKAEGKLWCHYHVGDVKQIDELNILGATKMCMTKALEGVVATRPEGERYRVLIDGNQIPPKLKTCADFLVKGDALSCSIAAASIVAKVEHDLILHKMLHDHPYLNLYTSKTGVGYPTPDHKDAVAKYGPTPFHRLTFAPCRLWLDENKDTMKTPDELMAIYQRISLDPAAEKKKTTLKKQSE